MGRRHLARYGQTLRKLIEMGLLLEAVTENDLVKEEGGTTVRFPPGVMDRIEALRGDTQMSVSVRDLLVEAVNRLERAKGRKGSK